MSNTNLHRINIIRRWRFLSGMFGVFLLIAALLGFIAGWHRVKEEKLLLLTFHEVIDNPIKAWDISYENLLDIINGLKRHQFSPLPPWDLETWLNGGIQGGRRFVVTFDDGFASSRDAILRLAREEKINSALFVILDLIGTPGYVDWPDLKRLADEAGCRIELHGRRHVSALEILKNQEDLTAELRAAKLELDQALGRSVTWYAYPFGEYNDEAQQALAGTGLSLGFTIDARTVQRQDQPLLLPRLMYLKGAKEAGEPVPQDWMPPPSAQAGSLTITLSVLVFFLSLRMLQRFHLLSKHLSKHLATLPPDDPQKPAA